MDGLSYDDDEAFAQIVHRLPDPDVKRLTKSVLAVAVPALLVGAIGIALLGMGWEAVVSFSASFLTGLVIGGRRLVRSYVSRLAAMLRSPGGQQSRSAS